MAWRWTPKTLRFGLNIYRPFRGAGIRIDYIAEDWREIRVSMPLRWYNRNIANVHFGGSLYAMVDPQYMVMLKFLLGDDYVVWDKAAAIEFISPGRGRVNAKFRIDDDTLDSIREKTASGEKLLPEFTVDIVDDTGTLIARVHKTLYVRRKPGKATL